MVAMLLVDGKILRDCPLCDGDGYLVKCLDPEKHGEDDEYKDSFQKHEEQQDGHKHEITDCPKCNAIGIVAVKLDEIVVLSAKVIQQG